MFTGIIQHLGTVAELRQDGLAIDAPGIDEPAGASVAVNGACLTVAGGSGPGRLEFDVMPVTFDHTALGRLAPGDRVNLEPALRLGDSMGGHWVQGHVDAVGTVVGREAHGNAELVGVLLPGDVGRYCIERGSIAIDGVSLTIARLEGDVATVSLIPETVERTALGDVRPGDEVNLEADVLARYVERLLDRR